MPGSSTTTLRLLGAFAIETGAERPAAPTIRSRKARALLAYLAMKPDWRAGREELATLLWGDTPDAQARHSLRQCLVSLRQDLHRVAPDLLDIDREAIELRAQDLTVDARELVSLAAATGLDALARAAELARGAFLADLTLDIEEFDAWRQREQERLGGVAARVFETLCANADAAGDGERAIAAAERLIALDPTREDRQRTALKIVARHRGRDAALDRARQLTSLLRSELAVAPEAATRALIAAIRNGEIAPSQPQMQLVALDATTPAVATTTALVVAEPQPMTVAAQAPSAPAIWRRRPIAAAIAMVSAVSIGVVAVLELTTGLPFRFAAKAPTTPGLASIVVLPFAADAPRGAHDQAFARLLTHDLTADLARYGELRIVSDRTADLYRDRDVDVVAIGTELNVRYAVVGHVQASDSGLRADVQLIDTATRMTLWSDHVQRGPGDAAVFADEAALGLARMLSISVVYAQARRLHPEPGQPPAVADLLLRARVAEMRSYLPGNLSTARRLYEEALQRSPHNGLAMLGVARTNINAVMNFIDLDAPPDVKRAESLLNEVLTRFPNWAGAHFALGMLQKYRRQFDAGLRSFQRSVELNPGFVPARGQIGALLTRMGHPDKGLEAIQEAMRIATANDPNLGFLYLFAGEAELELGHEQAALAWIQRADTFMPGSPLAQAWLASVYINMGDQAKAAKYIAALRAMAPANIQRFAGRKLKPVPTDGWPRTRILEGLRVAFAGPVG